MAEDWHGRSESVKTADARVRSAAETASGASWRGLAHDGFQAAVEESVVDLALLAGGLETAAQALFTYSEAVRDIKSEQEELARRRSSLQAEKDDLILQWHTATNEADGPHITYEEPARRAGALRGEIWGLGQRLDSLGEEWDALVSRRLAADRTLIAVLVAPDVRGALAFIAFEGSLASSQELMQRLSSLSESDLRALAVVHPHLLDRIRRSAPEEVAAWWSALSEVVQAHLIKALPELIGVLGGLPAAVRVEANRLVAAVRLEWLLDVSEKLEAAGHDVPVSEIAYLKRVVRGGVALYHYDPERQQIIEMFGDPSTADVLLSFVPGTNTSMDSFYTSHGTDGITSLTARLVNAPPRGAEVAGFVVKQGPFPHLDPATLLTEGPHVNTHALPLGVRYAMFERELDVITGDSPTISVEYSFASAVGGVAEMAGADFDARVMLAGIGMPEGWSRNIDTDYYSIQGSVDINRFLGGVQVGPVGYDVTPRSWYGFRQLDSGLPLDWPLDQHQQIISSDPGVNPKAYAHIARVIQEAAKR